MTPFSVLFTVGQAIAELVGETVIYECDLSSIGYHL